MKFRGISCSLAIAIGVVALSSNAHAQSALGAPLFAVLNGGNECNSVAPPAGPVCRKGDLDAIGSATILLVPVNTTISAICYGITVNNLTGPITAAHIHSGVSGINGPIVLTLAPPANGAPGSSSNCTTVPVATAAAIRADPTRFYVNIHNATFPGGAVRGQLH